jgi:hypothetical protein
MHIDKLTELRSRFPSRTGAFEVSPEDRKQWGTPCGCPSPQTKGHRYDCPHFRIVLKSVLERGSENEKKAFLEGFRFMLEVLSEDEEDKEHLAQLRSTLDALKILPQGDEQDKEK